MNSLRSLLYALARLLGDIQAIRKGTYHKRLVRKYAHRKTGGWLNRWLK